jgi:hypothetical protein
MSMYEKMMKTTDDRDVDGYMALLHDDYVFVRHQSGTEVSKADWAPAMAEMMASDKLEFFNNRCIYENDDVVVSHQVMGFPDGTKEAVLIVNTIQDGLIIRTETGATLLK